MGGGSLEFLSYRSFASRSAVVYIRGRRSTSYGPSSWYCYCFRRRGGPLRYNVYKCSAKLFSKKQKGCLRQTILRLLLLPSLNRRHPLPQQTFATTASPPPPPVLLLFFSPTDIRNKQKYGGKSMREMYLHPRSSWNNFALLALHARTKEEFTCSPWRKIKREREREGGIIKPIV